MLFVLSDEGVPSMAKVIRLPESRGDDDDNDDDNDDDDDNDTAKCLPYQS